MIVFPEPSLITLVSQPTVKEKIYIPWLFELQYLLKIPSFINEHSKKSDILQLDALLIRDRGNVPISDLLSIKPAGAHLLGHIARRKYFYLYLNIFFSVQILST